MHAAALSTAVLGVALLLGPPVAAQTAVGMDDVADTPHRLVGESGLLVAYRVDGDGIDTALTAMSGDAARGRAIVANTHKSLCLLCHAGPIPEQRFQGNLAPDLAGAGSRWSVAQLRLRIVDARRINPDTIMPAYYRTGGLTRVNSSVHLKPILNAQEVEDVVAYLHGLTARSVSATKDPTPQ